jgi:hypothetical protein
LERYDDFRRGVPFFYVIDGSSGFSQRVASVYHWGYFSLFDKSAKDRQVVSIHFRNEEREFVPDER